MALEHVERRAKRMRKRRKELGLTQEQVAERMQDIHHERHPDGEVDHTRGQMVSDWERSVNDPSGPKLELLAAALGWTVADLNADQPDKTETPDPFADSDSARLIEIERKLDLLLEEAEIQHGEAAEDGGEQDEDQGRGQDEAPGG